MTERDPETTEEALLNATSEILVPLVRVLLRNGIASRAITELVRRAMVGVAREDFGLDGKAPTQARISVITGLHRKEVSRLLREYESSSRAPVERRNRAAGVLSAWLSDPEFCDTGGEPRALPLNGEMSFTELCKRYSGDMKPRSIADELLSAGALEEKGGLFSMTTRGYVPGKDPIELVRMLGTDTAELIETIDHNLRVEEGEVRRFQSKVHYDNVPADCQEEFLRFSAARTQGLLEELDHWLRERDRGAQPANGERRIGLGLGAFHIVGESPHDDHRTGDSAGPRSEED